MGGHQLFLSLGGNLGKKREIFAITQDYIEEKIGKIMKSSSIYVSPAWGFSTKQSFFNQVIRVETDLSPQDVLTEIRIIENIFGRKRKPGRYLSRKMDIDILFFDEILLETEDLTIPHPLIALRNFVLVPFKEVAPDFIHPVLKKKMRDICLQTTANSQIIKLDPAG
jgi:2-amino-4-hydroxy-6-hydroxymethyldihydropteridine diphosphokinase